MLEITEMQGGRVSVILLKIFKQKLYFFQIEIQFPYVRDGLPKGYWLGPAFLLKIKPESGQALKTF